VAKCRYCGKGGWFSSTDANGLCAQCAPAVILQIQSTGRVVVESLKLAQQGKTFKTRLSRCDLLAERAAELLPLEQRGIPTITPPPSELLRHAAELRNEIILESAEQVAKTARDKADVATTSRAKSNAFSSGYLKAKDILEQSSEPGSGAAILAEMKSGTHRAILDGFLEAARKAEFKGNQKKAIDQYQEALFFIKNDEIPDEQQATEIGVIESAIEKLQSS